MKKSIFMTGFPGFLATDLLQQIINDQFVNIKHIYLLVLPHEKSNAIETIRHFKNQLKLNDSMLTIVEGDITNKNLKIPRSLNSELLDEVTHVFHLAAIYDLAVPEDIAWNVNVYGTKNVNDWVQKLNNLERYIYFSTAYVSGKREGKITEEDLSNEFGFRNHYEETKYEAEVLVEALKETVPTTIIRPGITKGNSITGKTIKFDGLYFMLNMYDRMRYLPFIPFIYDGKGSPEGNFVSSDYVLEATSYLAFHEIGKGKTYHLTDPNPYNMLQLQEIICREYLGRIPKGTVPVGIMKVALSFPMFRKFLRAEKEALDYFTIYSSYDATNTVNDLKDTNIKVMDLQKTLQPMIQFYRKYKDDHKKHIDIV